MLYTKLSVSIYNYVDYFDMSTLDNAHRLGGNAPFVLYPNEYMNKPLKSMSCFCFIVNRSWYRRKILQLAVDIYMYIHTYTYIYNIYSKLLPELYRIGI